MVSADPVLNGSSTSRYSASSGDLRSARLRMSSLQKTRILDSSAKAMVPTNMTSMAGSAAVCDAREDARQRPACGRLDAPRGLRTHLVVVGEAGQDAVVLGQEIVEEQQRHVLPVQNVAALRGATARKRASSDGRSHGKRIALRRVPASSAAPR